MWERERLRSLEAGFGGGARPTWGGALAAAGSAVRTQSATVAAVPSTLVAPRSCGESGWSSGRSDLAQGQPRLSRFVRPRRSRQWGHGAFSRHRRLGDHPPRESQRPQQRRRRPAIEEVGQTWAGCQPGVARLMPSVHFVVVSFGAGPARLPSAPRSPGFAAPTRRPKPAPLPASPLSDTHFLEQVTCRGAPSLPTPAPPPRLGLRVAAAPSDRAGQAQRCPHCPVSLASGHRKPGFRPRTLCSAPGLGAPHPAAASGGHGPRGSARAQRAAARKRGGGEEGAGAGWAAGGIPGSAQTGPGAARCEMRRRAAGTAGRGRRQNLPRTLRAARSRRPPPVPSALPS